MSQPEIISRAEVVAALGLGATISDADSGLVELLKRIVENEARRYCRHAITQSASPYIHFLPASAPAVAGGTLLERESSATLGFGATVDSRILQLPVPFVRSESLEVRVDLQSAAGQGVDAFGNDTLLVLGSDYYLDVDEPGLSRSGQLVRITGSWPKRPRTVRVSYFAGFTAAELDGPYSDIKGAVLDEVCARYQSAKSRQGSGGAGAIQSESIGGEYSVTYDTRTFDAAPLQPETRDRLAPYVSAVP
ncbi:MAG: hypothetical protein AB7O26_02750 [Planctomycetaceae bacterium]